MNNKEDTNIPKKKRKKFAFLYEPEDEVDFHGFWGGVTKEDIESFTQDRVEQFQRRGVKRARFIIGKGLHSNGEPLIPPTVYAYLQKLKKRGEIKSVFYERTRSGEMNKGALIVVFNDRISKESI